MESILTATVFTDMELWEKAFKKAHVKELKHVMLDELRSPRGRQNLYTQVKNGTYEFQIPHEAEIPKPDSKEMRTVIVSGNRYCPDRIVLAVINDALFKIFGQYLISERSKAYQEGVSTCKVVKELSAHIKHTDKDIVKIDFTKYFDRVYREVVFYIFDLLEMMCGCEKGSEPIINLLRKCYSDDRVKNVNGEIEHKWMGIRQGNPVSAFLANVVLKELDDYMSNKYEYYVRYSDDLICVGNKGEILKDIERIISSYGVSLNPKKTECYKQGKWLKFLGFNCNGDMRSLSTRRTKDYQKEILKRTVDRIGEDGFTYEKAVKDVMFYLYGNGGMSWATSAFPAWTVYRDLQILNSWTMDALRCVKVCKKRPHKNKRAKSYNAIGTVGVELCRKDKRNYTFTCSQGHKVLTLREECEWLDGYIPLTLAFNAFHTSYEAYECLIRTVNL